MLKVLFLKTTKFYQFEKNQRKSETSELLKPMDVLMKMVELDDDDFKIAARRLFKEKFSQDFVEVATVIPLNELPNDSLKLLNYFGDQIIKLNVNYSSYRRNEKTMDDAINTNHWKKSNSSMLNASQ